MAKTIKITSQEASEKDWIEYQQNVAGALTPVLTATVQSPYQYVLVNSFALRIDARDSNDDKIKDGDVAIAVSPPDRKDKSVIDDKDLRTYGDLSFTEQRQDDFESQVQYEVEGGEFLVETDFEVGVYVDSGTQIDTGNSYVEFEVMREKAE